MQNMLISWADEDEIIMEFFIFAYPFVDDGFPLFMQRMFFLFILLIYINKSLKRSFSPSLPLVQVCFLWNLPT